MAVGMRLVIVDELEGDLQEVAGEIGGKGGEDFRIYGTLGSFEYGTWRGKEQKPEKLTVEQLRDPLPVEVAQAFRSAAGKEDLDGGHRG